MSGMDLQMNNCTAASSISRWTLYPSEFFDVSQSVTHTFPKMILFRYVRQEMPLFVVCDPNVIDEKTLAQFYAEFAEEDRALANAGTADYTRLLVAEDTK